VLVRRDVEGRDTRLLASPGRVSHPMLRSGRVPASSTRGWIAMRNATPEAVDRGLRLLRLLARQRDSLLRFPQRRDTLDLWSFRESDGD
jgi:hypothetical protein